MCQDIITTEVTGSGSGPTELYPVFSSSPEAVVAEETLQDGRGNPVIVPNDTRDALAHDSSDQNSVSTILVSSYF